ncbi:MBL fold metallo-hydrolase [Halomonas caseinilytica]|uniref:MBL fold metallo-hydrolase n=1 Tax=Halomonas caseinilytica TaxID=438744 RepID=UPI0008C4CEC5|nr:MBL fold metallo-hydrolase [Halomonas caseinilytica]SEN14004.1 Glyoxylase, beta-lactamase superfamily II [Halomonas caseinilytica]
MAVRAFMLSAVLLSLVASGPVFATTHLAPNDSPGIVQQGADTYAVMVGDVRVTALSDGTVPQDLHKLLHGITNEKIDAMLARAYLANPVEVSINAFLLEMGNRLVLVDTGVGPLFGPGLGNQLIDSLRAAGVEPEQITDVLLTHVHSDHMGGLTKGGQIIFPNATVHVGKPDVDFFLDRQNAKRTDYDMRYFDQAIQSLKPYIDAGKVAPFDRTTEILPGLTASLHPGHTPGSAFYTLKSQGQTLTFIGDIIHVAAVQLPDPSVTIAYDVNPEMAASTRSKAFLAIAEEGDLVAVPHMSFPGIGHIRKAPEGYDWVPVDYGNRAATAGR